MYFYFLLKKKINSVNFNPLRSFKRQQLIKNIPLFLKKKNMFPLLPFTMAL